jgi:hypothetical protein
MAHHDCGCGGKAASVDYTLELGDVGEPPTLQEMERALGELGSGEPDGVDLQIADLEGALADAELPFAMDESDTPTLGSILAIAERYPGLKITFSF